MWMRTFLANVLGRTELIKAVVGDCQALFRLRALQPITEIALHRIEIGGRIIEIKRAFGDPNIV